MPNPRRDPQNIQTTAVESALIASQRVTESCLRLLAKQQKILTEGCDRRRADDGGAKARRYQSGADLADHYGRRSLDVDVEKL